MSGGARNIIHQAIFLDMYYFAKPPSIADVYAGTAKIDIPPISEATPQFRDIHISNVGCDGAEEGIFVRGLPEMNIRDIELSDMVLKAGKGAGLLFSINGNKCANIRVADTDRSKAVHDAAFYYGAAKEALEQK